MDAGNLIAIFEAAQVGRYGPMIDRASDAAEGDPAAVLLALVTTCCGLADRLAAVTGRPAQEVLAEQAALTVCAVVRPTQAA